MNEKKMRPVPTDLIEATLNRLGEGWSVEVEKQPNYKLTYIRFISSNCYAGDYDLEKIRAFSELSHTNWWAGVTHGGEHFMACITI